MRPDYFKIRRARQQAHLTQEAAGRLLGVNKTTVKNYEDNITKIPADVLFRMMTIYNVDLEDLTNG